jgi:hypothetical protein
MRRLARDVGELIDVVGAELVRAAADKPADAELGAPGAAQAGLLMGPEARRPAPSRWRGIAAVRPADAAGRVDGAHDAVTADAVRELAAKLVAGAAVGGGGRRRRKGDRTPQGSRAVQA